MAKKTDKKTQESKEIRDWLKGVEGNPGEASKMMRVICNSLILGFADGGRRFAIPPAMEVRRAVSYAVGEICGSKHGYEDYSNDGEIEWGLLRYLNRIGQRLRYGIEQAVSTEFETRTELEKYMFPNGRFEGGFARGRCIGYRFTSRKKLNEAVQEADSYWSDNEKKIFMELHRHMKRYIEKKNGKK